MPLFLIFVVVPIVEIALFIQVGGWLGLWPTLLIVVLTAFAGTVLVRSQGMQTIQRLQRNLAEGGDPVGPLAHGALILVGGILLLTPGFFTDAVALALLVPQVRAQVIRWGASRLKVVAVARMQAGPNGRTEPGGRAHGGSRAPDVVDAEYVVHDAEPPRDQPPRQAGGSKWTRPPG